MMLRRDMTSFPLNQVGAATQSFGKKPRFPLVAKKWGFASVVGTDGPRYFPLPRLLILDLNQGEYGMSTSPRKSSGVRSKAK